MAYMSQERKKAIEPAVKAALKKYGLKGSLSVEHHSTLNLNLREGPIDFWAEKTVHPGQTRNPEADGRELSISHYRISENFEGAAAAFLEEVFAAMMEGNHDRSDSMSDYFDVGWYAYVKVGKWNKPYKLTVAPAPKGWEIAETSTEEMGEAGEAGVAA